ncbi:MAG: RNA-binding protein [Salibacteraceae bacterium]
MKIFVAKLDYGVDSDELQTLFEGYGSVSSCSVITDRDTGRSKGFGFVEMDDKDEAMAAIQNLDGTDLHGRALVVKEAEERKKRSAW